MLKRIHFPDDTAYLQWLANRSARTGGVAYVPTWDYDLLRSLTIPKGARVNMQNSRLLPVYRRGDKYPVVYVQDGSILYNTVVDAPYCPSAT